jgi:hypothetical protein
MMRTRLATLALVSAAALLLAAPTVRAQDSGSTAWDGSSLTMPASTEVGFVSVNAFFTRRPPRSVNVTIAVSGSPMAGCAIPGSVSAADTTPIDVPAELGFECNGSYTVSALAVTTDDNQLLPHDEASRSGTLAVAMPAPTVTGVSALADGRSITVVWNDMRSTAKDLSGYVVERKVGDGSFSEVATPASDQTSFVDESLPDDAGEATYRVSSTRPSPAGTRVSAASTSEATPFVAAPAPPTTEGDGTTPGDGTSPGDTTAPSGEPAPGGSTPGDPGAPGDPGTPDAGAAGSPSSTFRAPRLGISGTFLPPLLRPSSTVPVPTTVDDGFSDRLPYSDTEPGEDDPVLPEDELASLFTEGAAGRGMAIPVATALVLAVWAFHLRFLARASRPTR